MPSVSSAVTCSNTAVQSHILAHTPDSEICLWTQDGAQPASSPLELPSFRRFMALEQFRSSWVQPAFGDVPSAVPERTVFLLWEREDGQYGLLVPLVDQGNKTYLFGNDNGLNVCFETTSTRTLQARILASGVGPEPYALINNVMAAIADELGSFRLRLDKRTPKWLEHFAWCTWDAFYQEVDADKVRAGLRTLKDAGVELPMMILDDGWLDCNEIQQMNSFEACPKKFPEGLAQFITSIRDEFGIECFGVWHALQGYWQGINPESSLADQYRTISAKGRRFEDTENLDRTMVHPDDATDFYRAWYRALAAAGVDMVKTDNHNAMDAHCGGRINYVEAMESYQEALQSAVHFYFEGELLHCMSNATEVAYQMRSSILWRNCQDYVPESGKDQRHVHMNALNNLWSATFSIPDWDMFQSTATAAEFHAASRAISGGPVYISDKPGEHDAALIRKLCLPGGQVLRSKSPALPTLDSIFVDCFSEPQLLKVYNQNQSIGVLGVFHCQKDSEAAISGTVSASDIHTLDGEDFAVWHHRGQRLERECRDTQQAISLPALQYEILSYSPIVNGIAFLGLLDKFNGSCVLTSELHISKAQYHCRLSSGGQIGLFCAEQPKAVMVNGEEASFVYDESGLLTICTPEGDEAELVITR